MPLPIILGIAAGVAGITGIGKGISGAVKMKDASDTQKLAQRIHERCQRDFSYSNDQANSAMDSLGMLELETMKSFDSFSDMIDKIHNKPQFKDIVKNGVSLPEFNPAKLKEVSVGAEVILGGLGGAVVGTAGGIAAAGATTTAVMALGTASTGTAIASLSGAAATNATLAALGGGAIAAGGGGIALGTTILGASTLGVGFLVGGLIFNATGSKLSEEADEAFHQACEEEKKVNVICEYLDDLTSTANSYTSSMQRVADVYEEHLDLMRELIYTRNKTDWNKYSQKEKKDIENTYLLVAVLYEMCKVQLVLKSEREDGINTINKKAINKVTRKSEELLNKVA